MGGGGFGGWGGLRFFTISAVHDQHPEVECHHW